MDTTPVIRPWILLFVAFFSILSTPTFAFDDQDNKSWSLLTEDHPFTVDPAMPHGFVQLPSVDTAPFYIRYNKDIYFKIPRDNLLQLTNIAWGHSAPVVFFRAEMLYPTFAGATQDTLKKFDFRDWHHSANIILITGPFKDLAHNHASILKAEQGHEEQLAQYDLHKITHHPIGASEDAYISTAEPEGPVVIICNPPKRDNNLPTCTVDVTFTDGYKLTYQYHRDLLPHWKDIHDHVLAFISASYKKE
jgi:hypothetical protein